jgi:gentisate 1,2-dioxygenase
MRWYLHPAIKDTCLSVLLFFQQEIPPGSRSGRLKFQGGQVMMITEGRGYTVIDGVKHPWKAGDVLNLPLRADGIIVQHFNSDPEQPARFVAAEPNWLEGLTVDRGCGFEQLEDAPEYRRKG